MEEGRIDPVGEPRLHGVFLNSHVSRRDHVAVYVVSQYHQDRMPEPNREIIAPNKAIPSELSAEVWS